MNKALKEQAEKILEQAEQRGVSNSYFFKTTFERYQVQLKILDKLEKDIKKHGTAITKEYVKGRPNLVSNPAISEYNKTATAANGTVSTLINIIKTLAEDDKGKGKLADLIESLNDE